MAPPGHLIGLLVVLTVIRFTYGAHILAVLPSVWKSHYIFGKSLMSALVAAPHNHTVTLISPHAEVSMDRRIREIRIDGLLENWQEMGLSFDVEQMRHKSIMERFTRLIYAGTTNVDLLLDDQQVKQLLRSDVVKFDLLVVDLFLSDSLLGLSHYYRIPTVVLSPTGPNSWLNELQCNPQSLALDPSNFLPFEERMSMWQRSINTLMGVFERLTYNFFYSISQQAVYEKHFHPLLSIEGAQLPHHQDLTKNISLLMLNSDPVIQYPRPYLPNTIEVAGMHLIPENVLNLPNHLRAYIEAAEDGVVYMSLGANIRTADVQRETLNAFLDAFAALHKMRFLLKWELDELEGCPDNVMTAPWYPQQAVLAHGNVKAFITSGGLMSLIEAIDSVTPMLIIPIQPEQEVNSKRMQRRGVALSMQYDNVTFHGIVEAVNQLILLPTDNKTNSNSFTTNLHELRGLFRSSALTPQQKALHYIDLVLRTSGAHHLRTHAHHLNYARSEMIDVISIIGFGLLLIVAIPFLVTCFTLKRSYRKAQDNQQRFLNAAAVAAVAAGTTNAGGNTLGSVNLAGRHSLTSSLQARYSYSGSSVTASLGDLSQTGKSPKLVNRQYSSSSDSTMSSVSSASASPKAVRA